MDMVCNLHGRGKGRRHGGDSKGSGILQKAHERTKRKGYFLPGRISPQSITHMSGRIRGGDNWRFFLLQKGC